MIFFTGLVLGAAMGALAYRYFYTLECSGREVICDSREKDVEIQKQLESLIRYGNDL